MASVFGFPFQRKLITDMPKKQKYGIRFPFKVDDGSGRVIELCSTAAEGVNSEIMHIIFTPKGQRLRKPDFGTRLIQFIFNPNDSQSWDDVVMEIKDAVKGKISNCSVESVQVAESDDGNDLYVRLVYSITENMQTTLYETIAKL